MSERTKEDSEIQINNLAEMCANTSRYLREAHALNSDLLEALEEVSRVLTMEEHLHPDYGWGDFIAKHISPALKKAKP